MDNKQSDKKSRRKFLSLGILGGAGMITQKANAMNSSLESGEMISLLTPDGKLVEVSKEVMEQLTERKKASNTDILNWSETTKNTKAE